jgi:hypothetical protein
MLPSVDKAGRYFPLTFAALGEVGGSADIWLDRCEDAGFAALEQDTSPDEIVAMIGQPDLGSHDRDAGGGLPLGCIWWTQGSPRVPETRLDLPGLPDVATYVTMLGEAKVPAQTGPTEEASWESPS